MNYTYEGRPRPRLTTSMVYTLYTGKPPIGRAGKVVFMNTQGQSLSLPQILSYPFNLLAAGLDLVFCIPILGRALKWLWNSILTMIHLMAGLVEYGLWGLGFRPTKKMRLGFLILSDEEDQPLAQMGQIPPVAEKAQQIYHAEYGIQWSSYFVAHRRAEFPASLVGRRGVPSTLFNVERGLFLLVQIVRDLDGAGEISGAVPERSAPELEHPVLPVRTRYQLQPLAGLPGHECTGMRSGIAGLFKAVKCPVTGHKLAVGYTLGQGRARGLVHGRDLIVLVDYERWVGNSVEHRLYGTFGLVEPLSQACGSDPLVCEDPDKHQYQQQTQRARELRAAIDEKVLRNQDRAKQRK